jgi:hypothetical protein
MILDENLTVTWLPETYINQAIQPVEYINITYEINDITDITDTESDDEYDP